ncbi:aspartate (tyrosine/aromatic) amino transferase [Streptococcus infantarius subsp. infantarius]|uniref:pyridoxal phosphate-dependent aminotransferase n=1 Tax=Streptococcus infantarius TaxID=102684 RepID=UPI00208F6A9D|nr:pyridoxal phosphate-dependent aminotransferase [Streptococcus infantarius]MCO4529470.1 aspartate (tyrosine/aromatic) amino transferase [Streptococcus infantarius subsp. infantarius]MCO4585971.1 aspartate (tyrosine/aromatic) amino transferase [Streptococcus infantarius subsp. infantarius]MCO4602781.1 aspartate (tyrosine/aromatic) amino transferase [Streptococcus infantarius subsp. infantarius]MCO4605579.1 aspartate (tyrosine/aromatic) amino transferase [Streptococcus infantarius subsp. infant
MKIFDKSSKLEHVAYDIRGPILDEANRMIANGEKILRLNTGNPASFGFQAPDEVIRDLIAHARNSEGYSDSKGIFSARKAIMQYCQLKGFPHVDIDDIYLGNGVSELISMSLQALLDDGDEVLVPMPDYPLWTACVSLSGGNAVHYLCDEQANWYPDIDDIKSKITSNTKAIVIINPNNPTGALYPDDLLKEIVEIARQNDLIIFADEIYDRLVMDGKKHTAIASLAPDVFCVSMNGLSKSHRICGFRVGWMVLSGPKQNVKGYIEGLNMLANMRLCANVLGQNVVQTSLGGYQSVDELLIPGGRIYEQRNFIYKAVNEVPGLSAVKPEAGLYIFPKIDRDMYQIDDDEQFCLELLKQEKVMLVPGKGFNWNEPDHFRIVYLPRVEELAEVQEKLTRVLSQYKR